MSGPLKSLSALTDEVRAQTAEVHGFVYRMRDANRRLTGSTGEQPTKLERLDGGGRMGDAPTDRNPLLVDLTVATEALNSATAELRAELVYFETMVSETGQDTKSYAANATGRG
jgi:hypothetical protein